MTRWIVETRTLTPRAAVAANAFEAGAGLPAQLVFVDLVAPHCIDANGSRVTITTSAAADQASQITTIAVEIETDDISEAELRGARVLDAYLDDLSFALQQPLARSQVDTKEQGGQRRFRLTPINADLMARVDAADDEHPRFHPPRGSIAAAPRRALRFFVRAMAYGGEEAYALYWIALENLFSHEGAPFNVREAVSIHGHHVVATCPVCGRPTDAFRQHPSYVAYLVHLGASTAEAEELWDARQVIHGKTPDARILDRVDRLRVLVGQRLATLLGQPPDAVQPQLVQALGIEGVFDAAEEDDGN